MRSRSNSTEGSTGIRGSSRHRERSQARNGQREGTGSAHAGRSKERHRDTGTVRKNHAHGRGDALRERDLTRDDLLLLLSVLEGELQARDEVIKVLEAERVDRAQLEARYGCEGPLRALQSLRSDALHARALQGCEDIYEKPMSELDRLVQTQRETHRRMLEQLLLVEQAHRQTLHRLEEEQRINCQLRHRSATFSSLQERERERLKLLIDRERANQERKEEESNRKVSSLKEALTQLKSFTLLLVDEQQRLTDQLALRTAKPQEPSSTTAGAEETPSSGQPSFEEEKGEAFQSEAETHDQANHNFRQEQEGMTAKLTNEDIQNRQLRQKLTTLSRQLDELEETSKILRRAEEELQDLRDKMSRGECGNSSLITEADRLRKRVLEMAGKDEELIKMEDQCRNLNNKLQKEAGQARGLRAEVDKLNRRIAELEKLEDAFSKSRQECCTLKCSLEKEKSTAKHLNSELDALKVRIKELEAIEGKLEGKETTLKEDLAKLKALTVMLVDERKTMTERLRDTESKLQGKSGKFPTEQDKVTSATEKLIEENKKALKSKAELEERMCGAAKERDELRARLKAEEEKSRDLQSKVSMMKKRLQSLETVEREFLKNKARDEQGRAPTANRFQQEDNKVKELTQELEKLRRKLKDMKVVENDLLKTEDDFESLEKKYSNEQKRAKALMEELEISRKELSQYQLAEKEVSNQENSLYKRLKEEEAKSSHLTREVEALKEKVHGYMGTEDSICRMKRDHAALQRRLTQQEVRNKELAREMENLTSELERYRRFSKSLRPGMNGRRFSDMNTSSKEVQTEPVDGQPPDYRSLAPLHQVSMNGREYEEGYPEVSLSPSEKMSQANTSSPILNSMTNNVRRSKVPFPRGKEGSHPINGTVLPLRHSGGHPQQGDMVLTHTPGQPLHIKVTPDHGHNVAMLEITSPGPVDNPHSYTSTAVIPTSSVTPPKQRITIIQNASVSPQFKAKGPSSPLDGLCAADRAMSPLSMATYSRAMTPESTGSISPDRALSPIQIVSVTTGAPGGPLTTEPVEVVGGHTVFRVIPERQSQWQLQRSNSSSPSIITTEDNKIHIHLGNPYIQALNSPAGPLSPCHSIAQEHRTPVLTNGTLSKGANKITSSITITPATSPIPRPSQMTVSNVYD